MHALSTLLGIAVLLPLVSFFVLLTTGRWLKAPWGGYIATGAIVSSGVLAAVSLVIWLTHQPLTSQQHHSPEHAAATESAATRIANGSDHALATVTRRQTTAHPVSLTTSNVSLDDAAEATGEPVAGAESLGHAATVPLAGDYYLLGHFGKLRISIGYYIDALTILMFCMVTLIASCIHFYSMGYMHEEEHEVTDHLVTLRDGSHLKRRGRYATFFQYMSLFSFSMLGLVLAGNVAMVFVFWELVGICSYFLIGFYVERKSASNAANKAFIVNRIGDFGMLIGLMAIWSSLGTFNFGDIGDQQGIFSQVRPATRNHELTVPAGMALAASRDTVAQWAQQHPAATPSERDAFLSGEVARLRGEGTDTNGTRPGYWLLIIAGVGIFCGCVGKSAQFPLHVWLPDAMEGPTPVSALVHSATMVAAGVYLVGRFYPVFAPEVLLVIAIIGVITLFMAATIAITATDIKRVLAYSTVSQLGYMMLALGMGGWLAGMMHLVTHAFFKSLLFLCSGSVIHAVHSNEMTDMGGLRKKMPITALTMLIGCLAIAGLAIPFVIGLSGYYSKDMILEQAFSFWRSNETIWGSLFFLAAAGGAAITAFYMFRLWFMTFAGQPRDAHRYEHAHESPKVMCIPLIVLALFAVGVAWRIPFTSVRPLHDLLEQARPIGTAATVQAAMVGLTWPNEHIAHLEQNFWPIVVPVTCLAFATAVGGTLLAMAMYLFGYLQPTEVRRQFPGAYRFLRNKWWFDELYDFLFVRPTHILARLIAAIDRRAIDWLLDTMASLTARFARFCEWLLDKKTIDALADNLAERTYRFGLALRGVQTGSLRQYVLFLIVGLIAVFLIISFLWSPTFAH